MLKEEKIIEILKNKPLTINQLCKELNLSRRYIRQMIDSLYSKKIIEVYGRPNNQIFSCKKG